VSERAAHKNGCETRSGMEVDATRDKRWHSFGPRVRVWVKRQINRRARRRPVLVEDQDGPR
jgi:hypothetical protein